MAVRAHSYKKQVFLWIKIYYGIVSREEVVIVLSVRYTHCHCVECALHMSVLLENHVFVCVCVVVLVSVYVLDNTCL